MFKEKVIEDFFKELIKKRELNSYGGKCIDIFFESYEPNNSIAIINYTVQIVNELSDRNLLKAELEIQIFIELIDDFTHLKGLPRTQEELYGELFTSVPDVGIIDLNRKLSRPNPQFEQYLSPLRLEGLKPNIGSFYREYRTHDEQFDWNETYSREVLFSF